MVGDDQVAHLPEYYAIVFSIIMFSCRLLIGLTHGFFENNFEMIG